MIRYWRNPVIRLSVCDAVHSGSHQCKKYEYWRPFWALSHILENFKWPYLSNASSDKLHVWF